MRLQKSIQHLLFALLLALVATLVALGAMQLRVARNLEDATFDLRALAFAPAAHPSSDIVMIWLDDPTMRSLPYRSPIPRDFLTELHRALVKAKPRLIAYDIFFKDASFPKDDRSFVAALSGTKAYAVVPRREDGTVDMPLPIFYEVLAGVGLADLPFNPFDATVRRAKLSYATDRGALPTFAAALFTAATVSSAEDAVLAASAPGLGPFRTTPFVGADEIFIRFSGPPGRIGSRENAFKTFSASLVITGFISEEWLQDKIVLVGSSSADLKDAYLTPYYAKATNYARMPGVEIHANVLSSLLTGEFFFAPRPWQGWMLAFVAALIVALFTVLVSPGRAAFGWLAVDAAIVGLAVFLFREHAVVAPIVAPLFASTAAYGGGLLLRALTEGRQKRFIKSVFARYVPEAVVERMTERPELLKLGGEERRVTSLFTDIASFTSISERLDPAMLVAFLNDYLGRMNDILFREGATLDKYEGDAIIAFFNAPLDVPGHEAAALRAALGIREATARISRDWQRECGREIVTRVGIATGPAVVGNMGSEGRFDYTAIGDTINLASRLEGANKFYGTNILASEQVIANISKDEGRRTKDENPKDEGRETKDENLKDEGRPLASRAGTKDDEGVASIDPRPSSFVVRPVDRVRVKGKAEPIVLFEIVGEEGAVDRERIEALVAPYLEAFRHFEARRIPEAQALLPKIAARFPDDGPSRALIARCERAAREPGWDLITDLAAK